ncbi:unnamed protein product [Gordionus sp. m RMFG-2023]
MEKFEITEDDIGFAFNTQAPRRRMTKEQHTYGIWADDDDDENTYKGTSISGRRLFAAKSYSTPIGFISGGVTQPNTQPPTGKDSEEETVEENVDANYSDDEMYVPPKKTMFKVKNYNYQQEDQSSLGDWEKHTKGIGQKLLLQMGYQAGKGLGKHGQGRTEPVEAVKRKGKGAIGAYGPEANKADKPKQDKDGVGGRNFKGASIKGSGWKKEQDKRSTKDRSLKPSFDYNKIGADSKDSLPFWSDNYSQKNIDSTKSIKVIDMTGKETKILTGYESISRRLNKPSEPSSNASTLNSRVNFDLPELRHNLDILMRQSENALNLNKKRLAYEDNQRQNLIEKRHKLEQTIVNTKDETKRLVKLLTFMDRFINPDENIFRNLDECKILLDMFKIEFNNEFKLYDLKNIITAIVFPMLKNVLETWEPLEQPEYAIDILLEWKRILRDMEIDLSLNTNIFSQSDESPDEITFQKMLWYIWMPKIRKDIQQKWDPRNSDKLINLIECWSDILPPWLKHNLLDQLIIPKLHSELQEWDPLTDVVPIHSWIHPWLPYIGSDADPQDWLHSQLTPTIRSKLASALSRWHPSDRSAKALLTPWKDVFTYRDFEALLIKHVLTKLNDLAHGTPYIFTKDIGDSVCFQQFVQYLRKF